MIKLMDLLLEGSVPDENINFIAKYPTTKPTKLKVDKSIIDYLERWKQEPTNNSIRDHETIEFWAKHPPTKIPPIIVADYGSGWKIMDGRHRAYANFIVNGEKFIMALVEPK